MESSLLREKHIVKCIFSNFGSITLVSYIYYFFVAGPFFFVEGYLQSPHVALGLAVEYSSSMHAFSHQVQTLGALEKHRPLVVKVYPFSGC